MPFNILIVLDIFPFIPPIIFIGVVLYILFIYRHYQSVARELKAISHQEQVPENLSPGYVGTLRDGTVHQRDLTATIIDLACKGYIHIEQKKTSRFWHSGVYILHKQDVSDSKEALSDYEFKILSILFHDQKLCDIKILGKVFQGNLSIIESQIFSHLLDHGYFLRFPYLSKKRSILFFILFVLIFIGIGFLLEERTLLFWFSFIASLILLVIKTIHFIPYTKKGLTVRHYAIGFESFLKSGTSKGFTQQEMEMHLAYAISLDVLDDFANICKQQERLRPPSWFKTQETTDISMFFSNIASFTHSFQASVFGRSNKVKSISSQVLKAGFSEEDF